MITCVTHVEQKNYKDHWFLRTKKMLKHSEQDMKRGRVYKWFTSLIYDSSILLATKALSLRQCNILLIQDLDILGLCERYEAYLA